jgi:2-methylaconitate cis-trans-isomerase PrpF
MPAMYLRGGTSKGVFVRGRDLPPPGPARDRLALQIMGSPDPLQIDGMGGTYSSTSKLMVVDPGAGDEDVRYAFAQVGVDTALVDWAGNCGNLTTAVGVFAIEDGIVEPVEPVTSLLLRNVNTGVHVRADIPVRGGHALVSGNHVVAGVPGSGAPIATHYLDPGGSVCGRELPTGSARDIVKTPHGVFEVSLVDVTHPYAFVAAEDVGLELFARGVADLNSDHELLARLNGLRDACGSVLSDAHPHAPAASPTVPRLLVVSPPPAAAAGDAAEAPDLAAVALSMGLIHRALPMTGALCAAAAMRMTDTVPARLMGESGRGALCIMHPRGMVTVLVELHQGPSPRMVKSVGVVRTARVLMSGLLHLPPDRS